MPRRRPLLFIQLLRLRNTAETHLLLVAGLDVLVAALAEDYHHRVRIVDPLPILHEIFCHIIRQR